MTAELRNLPHIASMAFNEPLMLEPAYARVFFCALGREMGAASLSVPRRWRYPLMMTDHDRPAVIRS